MAVRKSSFWLLLVYFVLVSGCSAMESKASSEAASLLEVAIAAIGRGDALCEATEFSSDDQKVFAVLLQHDFDVASYKVEEDGEGVEHQFILKQRNSGMLLSADIVAVRGECSTYTFARIVQSE